MARTKLTKTDAPGGASGQGAALVLEAADVANKNAFQLTGSEVIVARNTDGANPHNITITSVADDIGRTGDITEQIAAGAIRVYGRLQLEGWLQSDGQLYLEADDASVEFGVIQL